MIQYALHITPKWQSPGTANGHETQGLRFTSILLSVPYLSALIPPEATAPCLSWRTMLLIKSAVTPLPLTPTGTPLHLSTNFTTPALNNPHRTTWSSKCLSDPP